MVDVTCSACGKPTQVPFTPTEGRPVYCAECYAAQRPQSHSSYR
jgi:CxxC-x17-CxxC domain-containing protein